MARSWSLVGALTVLSFVISCATALARATPVLVAGPPEPASEHIADLTPDGRLPDRLYVAQQGRAVCIGSTTAAVERVPLVEHDVTSESEGRRCGEVPRDDVSEPFILLDGPETYPGDDPGAGWVIAAVRPDVLAIEIGARGGRRVRIPTVPAPAQLAGTVAGELRYAMGTAPAPSISLRLYDAAGALLHEDAGFHVTADDRDDPVVRGPVTVAAGGSPGSRWSVRASVTRPLWPLRGDPGRRGRSLCLEVARDAGGAAGASMCLGLPLDEAVIQPFMSCDPDERVARHVVVGVGLPSQLPRRIVTTDGRRVPLREVALPTAFGLEDGRLVVAAAPPGVGIRRADGRGPVRELHEPPPRLSLCGVVAGLHDGPGGRNRRWGATRSSGPEAPPGPGCSSATTVSRCARPSSVPCGDATARTLGRNCATRTSAAAPVARRPRASWTPV